LNKDISGINLDFEKMKERIEAKGKEKPRSMFDNLLSHEIKVKLRDGQMIKGILLEVSTYEIALNASIGRLIIMKHAIDTISL
jgi:sRNA-binding regulator protein Hfq